MKIFSGKKDGDIVGENTDAVDYLLETYRSPRNGYGPFFPELYVRSCGPMVKVL